MRIKQIADEMISHRMGLIEDQKPVAWYEFIHLKFRWAHNQKWKEKKNDGKRQTCLKLVLCAKWGKIPSIDCNIVRTKRNGDS